MNSQGILHPNLTESRTIIDNCSTCLNGKNLDVCDMKDLIEELCEHIDSITALVYISNLANFDEMDSGIHTDFLNGINIINNSSSRLAHQVKEYFYAM